MRTENTDACSEIKRPKPGLVQRAKQLASQPWFAYLALLLLQLKVVWKCWFYRDLTTGDTTSYYITAWRWHESGFCNIAWSPLYTTFYGTVLDIFPDPISATLLHRLLIVFAAGAMVLALMRKIVTPGIAWLTAAWWTVLPINFNTLYEVHLFAVLPFLATCLIVATYRNSWGRGAAVGLLVASTFLVRNEMSVATGLWALVCLYVEWRDSSTTCVRANQRLIRLIAAYGIPLGLAAVCTLFFYHRSEQKFSNDLDRILKIKHTLNMAQVYSFGYKQRNADWTSDPWVGYQQLMIDTFGKDLPSLREMIATNPRAVAEHFKWNFSLTPNGIQILLFNATSWERNPDYAAINTKSKAARILTAVLLGIWTAGLIALYRNPRKWWETCVRNRGQLWLLMACCCAVTLIVIPTQRPRPSYLFSLSITLMAITASCLHLITESSPLLRRGGAFLPVIMLCTIAFTPSFYVPKSKTPQTPVTDCIRSLQPFQELINSDNLFFVKGEFAGEVLGYLGHSPGKKVSDYKLINEWNDKEDLDVYLSRLGVNMLYLDQSMLNRLRATANERAGVFLFEGNHEWKLLATQSLPNREWRLFARGVRFSVPSAVDLIAGAAGSPAEVSGIATDGWTSDRLNFSLSRVSGANKAVVRGTVPLLDDAAFTTKAVMYVNNREVLSQELKPGDFELVAPLPKGEGPIRAEVRFDRLQSLPKGDGRRVSARVYSAATIARTD